MSLAEKVKELRDITGAGIVDCKNALSENNNDIEKSIEFLRKKGVLKAAKKSSRDAAEGLVVVGNDKSCFTITEINTETDFVAKNQEFIKFCNDISNISVNVNSLEDLISYKINNDTVENLLVSLISKIGENIKIRKFVKLKNEGFNISYYIHNKVSEKCGKIISLLKYKSSKNESIKLASDICMHIAALSPLSLSKESLNKDFILSEKKIIEAQTDLKNKNPDIVNKIIEGKLNKVISENVLLSQSFVVDPDKTIEKTIMEHNSKLSDVFEIIDFKRLKVGDGIILKKSNFEDEVKSLAQ